MIDMRFRFLKFLSIVSFVCVGGLAQESPYETQNISFEGNKIVSDGRLLEIIESRETPSALWKFLYKVSEKLGRKAEYFDPLVFEADFIRVNRFYADQGFLQSKVDSSLVFNDKEKSVQILFKIHEGKRSYVDTIEYRGREGMPNVVIDEVRNKPYMKIGDPYVIENVERELSRYVNAFANNGYAGMKVNKTLVQHYASTNNVKISFSLQPGIRYRFGEIIIRQDTTVRDQVSNETILDHLDFKSGDFFSEIRRTESERNLNRLGVFESTKIEVGIDERENGSIDIPIKVSVRPRPFHELMPEIGANDADKTFNLIFGLGYNNRNFFGGARNLNTRVRLNLQSIQELDLKRVLTKTGIRDSTLVSKAEISTQLIQPYFFSNKVSINASIAYLFEKQKPYIADILRSKIGLSAQLARYTRGTIDWYLERIKPEPLAQGAEDILGSRKDLIPQFNSIITFTLQRDLRNDLFSPTEGFFHAGTFEEAGLIPAVLGKFFLSNLPYSKYIKLSAVGQWYWDPGKKKELIWAARLNGGFAQLYGNSEAPVPLTRRFYAGGGGSVRGWNSRELGIVPFPNEGGSALFEGNLEARWHLFRGAEKFWFIELENISLVGFYDIGNVWSEVKKVNLSQIAMAAGIGFRWDTLAGPIRIDLAFRVYDPFEKAGRRWFYEKKVFHETFSLVQFGIGHAF